MRGKLKLSVETLLSKKNLKENGIINPKFYDDYVIPMFNGNNQNIQLIWNAFMFYSWLESKKFI